MRNFKNTKSHRTCKFNSHYLSFTCIHRACVFYDLISKQYENFRFGSGGWLFSSACIKVIVSQNYILFKHNVEFVPDFQRLGVQLQVLIWISSTLIQCLTGLKKSVFLKVVMNNVDFHTLILHVYNRVMLHAGQVLTLTALSKLG